MIHDIHTETPLIPEIIAQKVLWPIVETDPKLTKLDIENAYDLVQRLTKKLVYRAEQTFKLNASFRNQLLNTKKDSRETLKMFMQHWTLKLVKEINIKLYLN